MPASRLKIWDLPCTYPSRQSYGCFSRINIPPKRFCRKMPKNGIRLGEAWTKSGRVAAGLAVKEMQGWTSVFTTAIPLPAALWRNLARTAGAHVYSDSGDVLLADRSLVAIHSLQSGEKRIALPAESDVLDVITGQQIAQRTHEIRFTLNAPETRVFRLEPASK